MCVMTAIHVNEVGDWPGEKPLPTENATDPKRFLTKASMDTYIGSTWIASLIALIFGIFKCRCFAEILFGLSEVDAQLELREKHYDKIKRKSIYCIVFLLVIIAIQL